jgi:hypothetical protein
MPTPVSSRGIDQHQSEEAPSQDGNDPGLSPRPDHAYKRAEEPPLNLDGKMICKYKECANITFDRKCDWRQVLISSTPPSTPTNVATSKHMDKHDRPYKCNIKGCEKLQGFTYSGGLLRHNREVHKLHGGTKKLLFCPFPDCKRSSGSGFTRKENLAAHVRRAHGKTSPSSDLGHIVSSEPDTHTDEACHNDNAQMEQKRRRLSEAGISETGDETGLCAEVKRLKRENEERNSRLRRLEADVMALQQSGR